MSTDPNGYNQHEPGAKLDAGKLRTGLMISGFSRALQEVAAHAAWNALARLELMLRAGGDKR